MVNICNFRAYYITSKAVLLLSLLLRSIALVSTAAGNTSKTLSTQYSYTSAAPTSSTNDTLSQMQQSQQAGEQYALDDIQQQQLHLHEPAHNPQHAATQDAIHVWGVDPSKPTIFSNILTAAASHQQVLHRYKHDLSASRRRRSLVNIGAALRLRRVIADLQAGRNVSIGVIGGSISWGFYMKRGVNDWFSVFNTWLRSAFPTATIMHQNGCVPATTAEYVSMCLDRFLDRAADIVFVEYAINEAYTDTSVDTEHAQAFERLLRKLLHLPNKPAVVLMQVLAQATHAAQGSFYWTVQDHHGVLAQYYQLPWLSMRDAMFHEVLSGTVPGFTTRDIYPEAEQEMQRHPNELGHQYMADMAVSMVQKVYEDMMLGPISLGDDISLKLMQVPDPMFHNNYESSNLACLIGEDFPSAVVASPQWIWHNDGTAEKPKWGFSTNAAGATLEITLDTRLAAATTNASALAKDKAAAPKQPSSSTGRSNLSSAWHGASEPLPGVASAHASPDSAMDTHSEAASFTTASRDLARVTSSISASSSTDMEQQQHTSLTQASGQQPEHLVRDKANNRRALLGTAQLQWQHQFEQVEVHSDEWWAAQQAQAAEQSRSKLEAAYIGYQEGDMLVWVGYTKTWRDAGQAVLTCHGGCTCRNVTIDAYHSFKTTQSFMAKLYTQQAANCTVRVTVLPTSSSGGTYFKVSGVMVTRRIKDYDGSDHTDVLLLNAMEGEEYKQAFG